MDTARAQWFLEIATRNREQIVGVLDGYGSRLPDATVKKLQVAKAHYEIVIDKALEKLHAVSAKA